MWPQVHTGEDCLQPCTWKQLFPSSDSEYSYTELDIFSIYSAFQGKKRQTGPCQNEKNIGRKENVCLKKDCHLENELEQSFSVLQNFLKMSDSAPYENIVSKTRILSLIASPPRHFWLLSRVWEAVSMSRVNHLCCVQPCLADCIQPSLGNTLQFARLSLLEAPAKIRNTTFAMCIYSLPGKNKSRWI